MYVRLAFAVAAHMETEVLLVDEVLAVGDAEFQKKCLGKISDVSREGRTILFVSHNMGAVNKLCQSVAWLKSGRLNNIGKTEYVLSKYLSDNNSGAGERCWDCLASAPGNVKMRLRCVRILNCAGVVSTTIDIRQPFYVELRYAVLINLPVARVNFSMVAGDGTIVFTSSDINDHNWEGRSRGAGSYVSRCKIPGNLLNSGAYTLTVGADIPLVEVLFLEENVIGLEIEQTGGVSRHYSERWAGVVCPDLPWQISFEQEVHTSADKGIHNHR
jgi:lipopolysaccharide transport system ATP-binding protein